MPLKQSQSRTLQLGSMQALIETCVPYTAMKVPLSKLASTRALARLVQYLIDFYLVRFQIIYL